MRARHQAVAALAAVLVCAGLTAAQGELPADLGAMVETEREFARTALVKGIRDAFLEFFADDSLAFAPQPVSAKERLRSRPAQAASAQELKWEPRTGDIASSGELGWLTGPATFIDHSAGAKPSYSNYLSVWRKEPDGRWRVFIDFGIEVPEPATYQPGFTRFPFENRYRGAEAASAAIDALLAADRELNGRVADQGAARAYAPSLTAASRLNRNGSLPLVGPTAITEWLERHTPRMTIQTGAGGASRAGDCGYTYGTYQAEGEKPETGAYVRIWTRDAGGRWWIVADVTQPKR